MGKLKNRLAKLLRDFSQAQTLKLKTKMLEVSMKVPFQALIRNQSGTINVDDVIMSIVAFFLAGILLPLGLTAIYTANTSGWNSAVITVFQVLFPVLAIISIAVYLFHQARSG